MGKYNFVLMPSNDAEFFVRYAQIKAIDKYRLDKNKMACVTLCQFNAEEKEIGR